MAFKRRTFARKGSKLETRAHAARAFKRVVRQWELAINVKCQIVRALKGESCPNGGKIVLVSNAELQGATAYGANANFPDAMRIRRIEGNLYFRPTPITATDLGTLACYTAGVENLRTNYMRMGLRKAQGPQSQAGVPDALNPLNNGATPSELSDYVDGRWMKMWEHVWDPASKAQMQVSNNFSCCSTQAAYTVPGWDMATGSGDWPGVDVPPVVCQPCGDPEDPANDLSCGLTVDYPRWWHVPIRFGRAIVLKENDDLSLYFGWERMQSFDDTTRAVQPDMEFFGGIRMLLES